jgi:thymidylate kinase
MKVIVDGNDGTGKSTLVASLHELGFDADDRGLPTHMTDNANLQASDDEFYLILDASVTSSRWRLAAAGKDLTERYHTVVDLAYYRQRFLEVAKTLPLHAVVSAQGTKDETLSKCLVVLTVAGIVPVKPLVKVTNKEQA